MELKILPAFIRKSKKSSFYCKKIIIRNRKSATTALSWEPIMHFNENPIYVFPEKELRGFSPILLCVCERFTHIFP